jgi:hypothetical protein
VWSPVIDETSGQVDMQNLECGGSVWKSCICFCEDSSVGKNAGEEIWEGRFERSYVSLKSTSVGIVELFLLCWLFPTGCSVCTHLPTLVLRSQILLPWRWRRYFPPKRRSIQDLHSATSQKTTFFIVTAVKASNLTYSVQLFNCQISHKVYGSSDALYHDHEPRNGNVREGRGNCILQLFPEFDWRDEGISRRLAVINGSTTEIRTQ